MPKFFVISDVHGFYTEMTSALNNAGFNPENKNHYLISLGDNWDRGPDPEKVMNYFIQLPRKILIKGNHEDLFEELCNRGYANPYDVSNGTVQTVFEFGDYNDWEQNAYQAYKKALDKTQFFRLRLLNFFETKNYIFVHSYVPIKRVVRQFGQDASMIFYDILNPTWRAATDKEWSDARWINPYKMVNRKELLPDKTLVFGHWHCSAGWARKEGRSEFGDDAKFDIFYGDGFISIDACTALTKKCNCLVIEDDFNE